MRVWSRFADWILDYASFLSLVVFGVTLFLGYWATQVKTDHTAGRFLASDSRVMVDFERANRVFGNSETFLYIVFQGADLYDPAFLSGLDSLTRDIATYEGVDQVISPTNVPFLRREGSGIATQPLYTPDVPIEVVRERLRTQPFLRGFLLSNDGTTPALLVKIDPVFNDSAARVDLVDRIEAAVHRLPADEIALAGLPYLRTQYARRVTAEAPLFTLLALLVSLFFLFLTFRSWRAVFMPTLIVAIGIAWTIGLVALFGHRLNIVTSILPALIVIIGMANAVHLSTKFYDQYRLLQDRRRALEETIRSVGLATFLTSLTTAIGFAVLVLSGSRLLAIFGEFAAAGIMLLYLLSVVLIPFAYLHLRPPTAAAGSPSNHDLLTDAFASLASFTRRRTTAILVATLAVVAVGIVGTLQISSDIHIFSDFYEDDPLRHDLALFEENFGGVLPMEVVLISKRPGRFRSLASLRRIDALEDQFHDLESVGRTFALPDLVKLANQAYFGGNPATYRLPSSYELPFLQAALTDFLGNGGSHGNLVGQLPLFVDSTFTTTRIHMGIADVGTARMNVLSDSVIARTERLFPADEFEVIVTGAAIATTRSGENLVKNLILSLSVALVVISLLMAWLFRSLRLTLISLAPNVIPLLLVGAAMGFASIPLKPSTALIFSLAFGIAVDDTIHFLAKYRMLRDGGVEKDEAVQRTLRETGKAILFTSLVLCGGFLVFTLSSFGGTVSMGALTSLTLGLALVTNLVLLPALLYRFGPDEHREGRSTKGEVHSNRSLSERG